MVVHERFGILIPNGYPLEKAGPVFCAGITLYDPLMAHGATAGTRVGIVGLGGLGVMGLKLAKALGCQVTGISRLPSKRAFATETCGADHFVVSTDPAAMKAAAGSLDLVLNTVPAMHDCSVYEALLAPKGKQVTLGLNANAGASIYAAKILGEQRCKTVFSGIGGLKRTQEVRPACQRESEQRESEQRESEQRESEQRESEQRESERSKDVTHARDTPSNPHPSLPPILMKLLHEEQTPFRCRRTCLCVCARVRAASRYPPPPPCPR
jgi:D-arabinose 1-dehydrogenase-like Zn-dependent alcohol dehydrogenase